MVSDPTAAPKKPVSVSLNPCSNGIWSLTRPVRLALLEVCRLNPCSNGIWSLTIGRPVV